MAKNLEEFLDNVIEKTKDVELRQALCYIRDNEMDMFAYAFSRLLTQYPTIDPTALALSVANKKVIEMKEIAYCREMQAKRPVPNEKTARLVELMEHFGDEESDVLAHKKFQEIVALARDSEVDAGVISFNLSNLLHLAIANLGNSKYINSTSANRTRYLNLLSTLIDRGADLEQTNISGETPLLVTDWQADVVKLLHQRGANLKATMHSPFIPSSKAHPCLFSYCLFNISDHTEQRFQIIDYLFENGCDEEMEDAADFRFLLKTYKDPEYLLNASNEEIKENVISLTQLLEVVGMGQRRQMTSGKLMGKTYDEKKRYLHDYSRRLAKKMEEAYGSSSKTITDFDKMFFAFMLEANKGED